MNDETMKLMSALSAPFEPHEIKCRPGVVSGNRCLALWYVDSRTVMDRLDQVVGVDGWQSDFEPMADGSVICRLRVKIGDLWILKTDVGAPSEQPDGGDRDKASFTDGLKRAAVHFGISRYLYRIPPQWVEFNPKKKWFACQPQLPAMARPAPKTVTALPNAKPNAPAPAVANGKANGEQHQGNGEKPAPLELVTWLLDRLDVHNKPLAAALGFIRLPFDYDVNKLTEKEVKTILRAMHCDEQPPKRVA